MGNIKHKDIQAIGKLIVKGFSEDPKMKYQFKNIERKQLILKAVSESQVRKFIEKGEVYTSSNYEGAILGYNSKKLDLNSFLEIITACNKDLTEITIKKECDEKKIPILIETHNEENIDIYKHFGFEIVKEFSDENLDFKQYCMIRQPN